MDELDCLTALRISMAGVPEVSSSAEERKRSPEGAAPTEGATNDVAAPRATELLFLENTYVFECDAEVLRCTENEVVLSRTVFHPQGGGQPSDKGTISVGRSVFEVTGVAASSRKSPVVVHTGAWNDSVPEETKTAVARVDPDYRRLCARYHSAGHAIDVAMTRAGLALPGTKGYHWPDGGAYVEYDNSSSSVPAGLVDELNRHLADIVACDFETKRSFDDETGDRIVEIGGGDACPCGGTHVKSTGELGVVTVTKTKKKSGKLRVSYTLKSSSSRS